LSTDRELYYGKLSKDDLDKKVKDYENNYGKLSINDFSSNIKSLSAIIDFCNKNKIRLRIVWMPWNSYYTPPKYVQELKTKVNEILKENNIEVLDLSNKFNSSDFHDLGHLNREEGAVKFTEEVDKWLIK
jgi:predicted DNA-binding ArsR family transcriptional regulator